MSSILDVVQVNKTFGTVTAAENLNVRVAPGEVVGIVGANGAGKTVFVNMITGYEKPSSGKIVFEGRDITPLPPREHHAAGNLALLPGEPGVSDE